MVRRQAFEFDKMTFAMTLSQSDLVKVCSWSDFGKGGSELYVLYSVKDKPELFVVYCDANMMGWESESWRLLRGKEHPDLLKILKGKSGHAVKMKAVESRNLERVDIIK